jgi:outer membrane protein TolC
VAAFAAGEAWVRLAQAREQVELLERSLATVEAHAELAASYVERGTLVASERLRAEVERSRVADQLAEARGQARNAEAALSFRLAADPESEWRLAELPEPATPVDGLQAWIDAAATHPDLAAVRELATAAALETRIRQAARRPRVGLTARYDLTDESLFGTGGEAASILAAATFDLFAGGRHHAAVAAAEAEAAAAATEAERFADAVRLEVRQAWEAQATARARHATAQGALTAAAEAERIVGLRFRQGIVKTIDLLDATTARRETETRELVARTEAHLALLRLARAAGRAPESVVGAEETNAELARRPAASGSGSAQ